MSNGSDKLDEGVSEPLDNFSSLLDVASEVEANKKPKNDPTATILSDAGEVINLNEHEDNISKK